MAFAWSGIDGIVPGPDRLLADGGEAGALGETLTNQPVGVPVAAALVVPEFLRTLVFARPRGDDQFADCTFSPSLDMSR